jgi:hypothetical protein
MWEFKLPNFCKQDCFPPALLEEVVRLKTAIDKAKQEDLDPQFESEVQDVIRDMISSMPFANKFRELGQAVQSYCTMQELHSELGVEEEGRRVDSLYFELRSDKCFEQFYKALQKQGISELPFLKE